MVCRALTTKEEVMGAHARQNQRAAGVCEVVEMSGELRGSAALGPPGPLIFTLATPSSPRQLVSPPTGRERAGDTIQGGGLR